MSDGLEMRRRQFTSQQSTVEIRKKHAVSVRGAHKSYGTKKHPLVILSDLNMTVPKGTIYGLLGSSGCGKTTLLNCIIGRKKFNSGELWVLGGSPGSKGSVLPGPQIGYMPQEIALYSEFSIRETMKYFGWIAKMSSKQIQERLDFLVELLMLPDVDRKIKNLSGGQQRRVSFATVLLHEPELLILDEPTVGLDPILRETIWKHLTEITNDGSTTVVLTTHYIEETRHAHLIGLMRSGYIMAEEAPHNLLTRFETDTLEDAFLKLSIMQNMGRRRRSIAVHSVISTVTLPTGIVNRGIVPEDTDTKDEISAEFGDGVFVNTKRRFSLVTANQLPQIPTPIDTHTTKISDYLIKLNPQRMKALIWKNFLWMVHNWTIMLTIMTLPIIQFSVFYVTVGHAPTHLNIGVVNYESNGTECSPISCNNTKLSCNFLEYLKEKHVNMIPYESETSAVYSVDRGLTYACIIIKENYTMALKSRFEKWRRADNWDLLYSTIEVYRDVSVKDVASFLKLYLYDSFVLFISDYLDVCEMNKDALKLPIQWNPPVYGNRSTDFTEFAAPGALMTITFFLSAGLTTVAMLIERNEGILERSLVMGVTAIELLTSHVISEFVVMIVQIVAVVCFGIYTFEMALKGSLFLLLAIMSFSGFCGMWYGFAVSSACDREGTAAYILLGSFFPMILLCGAIWPIEERRAFCEDNQRSVARGFILMDAKGVVAVLCVIQAVYCVIPSYIKVCPHDHPKLAACITNSIEELRPRLKTGIPELDIPGLEPFELDPIEIDSIGGGTRLATNISDIRVYGASSFKILKLTPTLTKKGHNFRFEVIIPRITILAEYELDSRILFLDLKGKGPFNANVSDYHFECIMKGNKIKRNNNDYLEFEQMKCNLVIGKVEIYLDKLFEGNPTLSKATNNVINDNANVLFEEIKPGVLKALTKRFTDIANKITLSFLYEELFP
ncbi:hypothetical protein RN001_010851 [Aquatica leii]|uniref:ABC transporter domain-containing protein n=1 Tax=Aquatica leii TaxID=1421715 RepID=A0AAN7Q3L8_9COLE|nr:hypothetical protein RN001_010851 [Aquatica leii]